jgi:hypothetical protein
MDSWTGGRIASSSYCRNTETNGFRPKFAAANGEGRDPIFDICPLFAVNRVQVYLAVPAREACNI